jgi:hypothetical protein
MFKNFKASEMLIVAIVIVVIAVSEYNYLVVGDKEKAIFIGLWPPTIPVSYTHLRAHETN